eukprot:XP_014778803.1 PREDICTED: putative uncharacterized protein FLJ37770 [Octopus bimaculoides]
MLRQAYSDEEMGRTQCFERHWCLEGGRTSLEDDERSGRPAARVTPSNVEKIHGDRRRTINDNADVVCLSYLSVQVILTSESNIRSVSTKFVPRTERTSNSIKISVSVPLMTHPSYRGSSPVT